MKIFITFTLLFLGPLGTLLAAGPNGENKLKLGDAAPDFTLPSTEGKTFTLANFSEPDVLMIYFTGTHCPVSHAQELRMQKLITDLSDSSFGVVAINPNHNDGIRPDEFSYSKYTESFEDSKQYAKDLNWTFPFLYDGEEQTTARAYGVTNTPHVFVFDKERKLRYVGRFDDSRFRGPETVKQADAENAIRALLAGKTVDVAETKPMGCSTKWKSKKKLVIADNTKWANKKAEIEEIDAKGIAELVANGTNKVRLFNVWSSTCPQCTGDLPQFKQIVRRYSRRDLDFISLSKDDLVNLKAVANLLTKHQICLSDKLATTLKNEGRKTNNYLITEPSTEALVAALDPSWDGKIPYTILVNTEGEIVFRKSGIVNQEELKAEILKEIKEYFVPVK